MRRLWKPRARPSLSERLYGEREGAWRTTFRRGLRAFLGKERPNRSTAPNRGAAERNTSTATPDGPGPIRRFLRQLPGNAAKILVSVVVATLAAAVPVGAYVGYALLQRAPHFLVRQVEVSGADKISEEEIVAAVGLDRPVNSLTVDVDQLTRAVRSLEWVRTAHVELRLPNTIRVDIEERRPRALIALERLFMVDERGAIFRGIAEREHSALPILTGFARLEVSDPKRQTEVRRRVRQALAALDAWEAAGLTTLAPIGEIEAHRVYGPIVRLLHTGGEIWLGEGQFAEKALRAADVLADLARRGRRPRRIYLDGPDGLERVVVESEERPAASAAFEFATLNRRQGYGNERTE